jgi:ATP synthase F1 delta subunit
MMLEEEEFLDEFVRDVFTFDILCSQNFEISDMLFNPLKSIDEKLAWANEMLIIYFSDTFFGFLKQLIKNEDIIYYDRLRIKFLATLSRMRNCLYAKVTSYIPLTEEQSKRVANKLKRLFGKQVFVYNKVSRYFSGGLLIECGNRMIDLGIRTGLYQLKGTLNAS